MLEEKITLDKLVRWILCGLIILAVFYITNSMSEVLLPFFIACLLAYLLYPLVRLTEKYLHIRIRPEYRQSYSPRSNRRCGSVNKVGFYSYRKYSIC